MTMTMINPILLLFAVTLPQTSIAFHLPSRPSPIHHLTHRSSLLSTRQQREQQQRQQRERHQSSSSTTTSLRGFFFDDEPDEDEITIPPELRDEIYAAESNTPAAQGRRTRIIAYAILTFAGVTTAFFNAFLSDLRFGDGSPSEDLAYYGFGWVMDNWATSFALTNKIGGGIGLLGAGLSGTLAEVEIRSKKENAEQIWTEMQRRKSLKEKPTSRSNRKKNKKKSSSQSSSRKNMTGKQKKRLSALEELMDDGNEEEEAAMPTAAVEEPKVEKITDESKEAADNNNNNKDGDDGIFGSIKGFYKQADSMAASQALLLNKELEDRGIVDKITDETGLKVVGKEEAAKAAKRQKENEE